MKKGQIYIYIYIYIYICIGFHGRPSRSLFPSNINEASAKPKRVFCQSIDTLKAWLINERMLIKSEK